MGLFRDMLNEARNTSVPTEYRIALGQLKRMYNTGEVPVEKELQKIQKQYPELNFQITDTQKTTIEQRHQICLNL